MLVRLIKPQSNQGQPSMESIGILIAMIQLLFLIVGTVDAHPCT